MVTEKMIEAAARAICQHCQRVTVVPQQTLEAALSTDAEPVRALEWTNNEARSTRGDLYSVAQLSQNVWTTYLNGVAFTGWKTEKSSAIAVTEAEHTRRSALSAQVQDVAEHREIIARFFSEMWEARPGSLTADDYMEAGGAHKQADELLARLSAAPAAKQGEEE